MAGQSLYPNRVVQSMTQAHREKLGQELLDRAYRIYRAHGRCEDHGSRIVALLEAGADVSLRTQHHDPPIDEDFCHHRSALLLLLQSGNLPLCRLLLQQDAPLTDTVPYTRAIEQNLQTEESPTVVREWKSFQEDLLSKARQQQQSREERETARNQANEA